MHGEDDAHPFVSNSTTIDFVIRWFEDIDDSTCAGIGHNFMAIFLFKSNMEAAIERILSTKVEESVTGACKKGHACLSI